MRKHNATTAGLQNHTHNRAECAAFSAEVYIFLKKISAGLSSKRRAAEMCQRALAQKGYFASMCLMSPTQQAPTAPLETTLLFVCVRARVRQQQKTKVPGEFAVVVLGLVSELESVGGKDAGR